MTKSGAGNQVTGFRYYFSVLAGVCRGPVDQIFQIKSGGYTFYDGNSPDSNYTDSFDPNNPFAVTSTLSGFDQITDNCALAIRKDGLYGGDKAEGGIDGVAWVYMGAKDQIIAAGDYIKNIMGGLRLSDMRGVLTVFFDGEITANNPYPKAWTYRVRRILKGWDGDVWYPERALIVLTDPSIPSYARGGGDSTFDMTTVVYNDAGVDVSGASTSSGDVTSIISNYNGASVTTYASGAVSVTYAVPPLYNEIHAMNPAHIIYECCTNRDWGRGMDRSLIDNVSFTDAANRLYEEGFGLCLKWSRTEDIDTFVQMVIDHIGAAVYTDRITGLLCLRLLRADYSPGELSVFDYNSGLVGVTSVEQPASDTVASEVIIKYRSPVLDAPKEARVQNIALIDNQGSIFNISKDYSGLPTSTLALQVAQRELKAASGGWKRIEFKLDRRAYRLVPADVIIVNAPDKGINSLVIRVITVEDSVMTDGTITVVGSQDIYGLPVKPAMMVTPEPSTFLDVDRYPKPLDFQNLSEATYRDAVKVAGVSLNTQIASDEHKHDGLMTYVAKKPTPSHLNFTAQDESAGYGKSTFSSWSNDGTVLFSKMSALAEPITSTQTIIPINGEINALNTAVGSCLMLCSDYETYLTQEFVRLEAITVVGAQTYITVARGCVDTPAIPHPVAKRVWAYDNTASVIQKFFTGGDTVAFRGITHTTAGDLDPSLARPMYGGISNVIWTRLSSPYCGADFRVNGWPRDATPPQKAPLTLTWNHRNRIIQQDTLVGELEAGVTPETDQNYGVIITGTTATGSYMLTKYAFDSVAMGTTDNTIIVSLADLDEVGIISGPMRITFQTGRRAPEYGNLNILAFRNVVVDFVYSSDSSPAPTPTTATTGFDTDFSNSFSGA